MIPEGNPYNNWKGNGKSRTFDFDFYIEDETQLAVYHTNSEGAQVLLECGKDYIVNGIGNANGGNIEFPYVFINEEGEEVCLSDFGVLQEGEVISLCLSLPISQENPLGKSSYLNLETLEYSLDYLTRICQILNRQMERSVKTQEGSESSAEELMNALNDAQVDAAASASAAHNSAVEATEQANIAAQEAENAVQTREEFDANCREVFDEFDAKVAADKAELASLDATIKKDADAIINRVGLNMFDTVVKDHVLSYEESKGLALQGTWVYKNAVVGERYGYADFYNKCLEEIAEAVANGGVQNITLGGTTIAMFIHANGHMYYDIGIKDSIDNWFNTFGTAWFYGVDTANERIFLPRNNWFEQMTGNGAEVGDSVQAGLPNIEGRITMVTALARVGTGGAVYHATSTGETNGVGGGSNFGTQGGCHFYIDASYSNSIYGNSDTVQPNAVKKLLYICVGNTVSDTSWVDVVTQVEGGVKDLEDKKNTSIAEIGANAKSYGNLTHRQITNCILEVPQRIKYELNEGTLTIKAGSVVIVPYGTEDLTAEYPIGSTFLNDNFKVVDTQFANDKFFVWVELVSDTSNIAQWGQTGLGFTFIDLTLNQVLSVHHTRVHSGVTEPTREGSVGFWYDTTNNYNKMWKSAGFVNDVIALPVLTVNFDTLNSSNNYSVGSVNQIFNGMGYIGAIVWADKGVKGLIPNGRNEDGSLNNIEFTTNKVMTTTNPANARTNLGIKISTNGINRVNLNYYKYDEENNLNYDGENNEYFYSTVVAVYDRDATGAVTLFQPKQPFRAVDYNEISEVQVVVETYKNGTSWYRVWSDGWCEQGGLNTKDKTSITLLKPYKDTTYHILFALDYGGGNISWTEATNNIHNNNRTTTGFTVGTRVGNWQTCGYIA